MKLPCKPAYLTSALTPPMAAVTFASDERLRKPVPKASGNNWSEASPILSGTASYLLVV